MMLAFKNHLRVVCLNSFSLKSCLCKLVSYSPFGTASSVDWDCSAKAADGMALPHSNQSSPQLLQAAAQSQLFSPGENKPITARWGTQIKNWRFCTSKRQKKHHVGQELAAYSVLAKSMGTCFCKQSDLKAATINCLHVVCSCSHQSTWSGRWSFHKNCYQSLT